MHLNVVVENAALRPGLQELVEHRIKSALGRFADHMGWVSARLQQVNSSSGDQGHQCRIEVSLISVCILTAQARAVDAETAVDLAVERTVHRIKAELDRRRASQERASVCPQPPIGT